MATKHIICDLDLNGNQIKSVVAEVLASPNSITNPVTGQFYYDSTKGSLGYYNGSSWVYTAAGNVYAIDTLDDDSATDRYKLYYGSATGTSGVNTSTTFKFRALKGDGTNIDLSTETSGSGSEEREYIKISLNDIAISKVTGLQTALDNKLDDSQLSTATSLIETGESTASDTMIPSQKAVKTYIDTAINGVNTDIAGAMHFIGTWDGTKTIAENVAATGQAIEKLRKGDYWLVDVACPHSQIPSGGIESSNPDGGLVVGDMIIGISNVAAIANVTASDFKVIDNSESADLVRLNATQTLTNKTISGSSNTFSNIPESAVTNLTTDLASKVDKTSITTTDTLNTDTTDNANKATVPSDYTVGKVLETFATNLDAAATHYYKTTINTAVATATVTASTHGCGLFPEVKVYQASTVSNVTTQNEVVADVTLASNGDVIVNWNGAITVDVNPITIVIIGKVES